MKIKLGTRDGAAVYAIYGHCAGSLPEVTINGTCYSGSSIGPAHHLCDPDESDIAYWQSLAGLQQDIEQAKRSLSAVRAARTNEAAPYERYLDELLTCHCGAKATRRCIEALGECCECSESRPLV